MTIQANNSHARPVVAPGAKPLDQIPADEAPIATAPPELPQRDSLKLSTEVSIALAAKSITTPEATTPEAKQPEAKPPEAKKSEVTTPEAKPPEATTPEVKQPEAKQADQTTAQADDKPTSQTVTTGEKKPESGEPTKPQRKPLDNFPIYHPILRPMTEQKAALEKALEGQALDYKNTAGATVPLAIVKGASTAEGAAQYQVKVAGVSIDVTVAPDLDAKDLLLRLVDSFSKVPEHLRANLKKVALETRKNPEDELWAKTFNHEGFSSAATAGGHAITFWNLKENTINFCEGTFNHEFGHLVGEAYSASTETNSTRIPRGWAEAAKADNEHVSNYAKNSGDEDFAETWSYFVYALTDPETRTALLERAPNRAKILEDIYRNTFDKEGKKDAKKPEPPQLQEVSASD